MLSMSKKKQNKDDCPKVFEIIEEDGRLKGRIHVKIAIKKLKKFWKKLCKKLRKLWKRVKKFFKTVWFRVIFTFNPKSDKVPRKYKYKFCSTED